MSTLQPKSRSNFRKRQSLEQVDSQPISSEFRDIRDLIQRGKFSNGLGRIDTLLENDSLSLNQKGRLLALAADSEFKRGAFMESAALHSSAAELLVDDSENWIRPHMGRVRSLLKSAAVEEAVQSARETLVLAKTKSEEYKSAAEKAETILANGGSVIVSPAPHRLSAIAARLGRLFLREGEIDAAKEFLNAAITHAPKGATRARESLAEIALRENDLNAALQWAMQAITIGRLQAKTLSALALLIQIKRRQGDPTLGNETLALVQTAKPSVRARAYLVIVRELRSAQCPQWKTLANQWLENDGQKFPVIAVEMKKLLLRELKQSSASPELDHQTARDLLSIPSISPTEWISAAKELVRSAWFLGQEPDLDRLIRRASEKFGQDFANLAVHSVALSTMMAKRHDVAIPWLEEKLNSMPLESEAWGKSVWALARIEAYFERHDRSANFYDLFAKNEIMPLNLRAQARLNWVRALLETGDTQALVKGLDEVRGLLPNIHDISILLAVARQLLHVPNGEGKELAEVAFAKAEDLAIQQVNTVQHPSVATTTLLQLARKTSTDFNRPERTVAIWNAINTAEKEIIWTESSDFWEYLSIVISSHYLSGDETGANNLLKKHIDEISTPINGKVVLLVAAGDACMRKKLYFEGIRHFRSALKLGGKESHLRIAHYWLAMIEWSIGNLADAKMHAKMVSLDSWNGSGFAVDWLMAVHAEWILADFKPENLNPLVVTRYGDTYIKSNIPSKIIIK